MLQISDVGDLSCLSYSPNSCRRALNTSKCSLEQTPQYAMAAVSGETANKAQRTLPNSCLLTSQRAEQG